ncbi:outer membrane protein assembly factor BamA [bacterium]|nr:outer membrane protein assembly factor BamA [bacterium]
MRSLFASALALSVSSGALAGLNVLGIGGAAWAQQAPTDLISRVVVENNQRIEARTVESYLLVRPGDPFDPERIDLSLKTLFATGLFADVLIERRGNDLVVRVIENPIINRVLFEGNSAVTEEKLLEETEAEPRATLTQSRVQQDVQRILEIYRRAGRFAATVSPQYKPLPQNRVDLIFEIDEGPTTGVRSINFIGNEAFSDRRLRSEIVTRQSRWWRFFDSNDNYDPGRVEYDRDLIRQFYMNEGYADFRVTSAVAELTPDQKDFYITYTIDEGPKYNFGEIKVETQLEKLSGERLALVLPMQEGRQYRSKSIEDAIDTITFAAGTAGYANVDVVPQQRRNPDTQTVDITFAVDEGPRVYIERLDIVGNTQTLDRVIRREVRVAEGDAFNRVLLDSARSRIRGLGFFKEVEIEEEAGSTDDRTVVKVRVEEEPTGELGFSAGFSSQDDFLFSLSATQRNFRGRGQFLSARVQTTSRQQDIEFRFTEPKFQDRNLAVGADLFVTQSDFFDLAGFENSIVGAGGRILFPISESDQLGLRYNLRNDDLALDPLLTDCSTAAFFRSSLCDQQGSRITSAIGYSIAFNRTNDFIEPTRGFNLSFSQDIAGLGGDVNYIRTELRGATYYGLFPKIVASATLDLGYIEGWNNDIVRINNRFFKGGNDFRGFDVAGLGPREVQYFVETQTIALNDGETPPEFSVPQFNDDGTPRRNDAGQRLFTSAVRDANGEVQTQTRAFNALGGKAFAIGSLELSFPIPYVPDELGIDGALFAEFGTVGILEDIDRERRADDAFNAFRVDDSASLRASAGVSIFWDSPFGPVRFDFSQILAREDYDRTETFRFSTNTRF